ncbi:hypothetical protein ADK74_13855 [Streptomyces decoyicus]|nr:hypothetical protein ADK74_13855 [Streptomyces decoyicus]
MPAPSRGCVRCRGSPARREKWLLPVLGWWDAVVRQVRRPGRRQRGRRAGAPFLTAANRGIPPLRSPGMVR